MGMSWDSPAMVYQHYKGDLYRVLDEDANMEEDGDTVVIYKRLDLDHPKVHVRRHSLFFGSVEHEGATVPRFRLVSPSELHSMVKAQLKAYNDLRMSEPTYPRMVEVPKDGEIARFPLVTK